MVKGSWITSGAMPMAGGGLHWRNFSMTPLRHSISGGQEKLPRGVTPVAQAVTTSHRACLISSRRMQPDVLDLLDQAVFLEDRRDFAHLVPEHRMEPVLDVEQVVFDIGEHRLGAAEQLVELFQDRLHW
jgi:hypothetical protein